MIISDDLDAPLSGNRVWKLAVSSAGSEKPVLGEARN